MTRMRFWPALRTLFTVVFVAGFAVLAHAQSVDPCGYGCPKDGCPQCGGGGPINQGK